MTMLYVYAVTDGEHPDPTDLTGVNDAPVRLIRDGTVAAAVSPAPESLVGRRRDLLAHSSVVESLWTNGPVLPLRFGTVAPDEDALRADVLDDSSGRLGRRLAYLTDRAEMSVKAWHREEVVLREVVAERRDVAALQARTRRGGSYDDQIRLGELVAGAVEAKQAVDADRLLQAFQGSAIEVRPGPPVDGALLNASFLVDRDRVEEFSAAVQEQAARNEDRLTFRVAGPLPPYSFVEGDEPEPARRSRPREAAAAHRGRR